jgi:hypothetical protein
LIWWNPKANSPEGDFHGTDVSEAIRYEPEVTLGGVWANTEGVRTRNSKRLRVVLKQGKAIFRGVWT